MIEITQYQIVPKDKSIDLKYNGQTTDFERRKYQHTRSCVNPNHKTYNYKIYQKIREQGGFDNFEFVILEIHLVNDMSEARIREQYWYNLLESNMNGCNPLQTSKEWLKKYRQTNKYKEYNKIYHRQKITCECGLIISRGSTLFHKKSKKHIDLMNATI
jgi:hypothetical protein